ncbi:MAG: formate dehydrogenase accessory protein FdhE [Nitrospira sp.]|nr:formate dehydrogenase accessory protein FdhE [Nitrospira sp.]
MKKKKTEELNRIIKRINVIGKNRPTHKEVLDFFKYIIREQHKIKPLIKVKTIDINEETAKNQLKEGFPLIDKKDIKLDLDLAATLFKNICRVLQRKEKIAPEIKKINQAIRNKGIDLMEIFGRLIEGDKGYIEFIANKAGLHTWLLSFLAESSINPFLEEYAEKLKDYVGQEIWFRGYCPACGSAPVLGELRNLEGVEGAKSLVCSSCSFQWRFKRLACPFCGNEDHKKLRYFNTEADGKAYRVDVCEECKKYIKTIDLRETGEDVIPLVEDMGTLHLDIIAQNEGYKRGVTNILETEKLGTDS